MMFLVDGDVLLNIIWGSQDHRDPLMDALGLDVQHIHASCGGHSSSLLSDEGHGVALIQESELSFGTLHIGRVEENASINNGPMNICYHGAHVAGTIGCTAILQKYTSASNTENAGITVTHLRKHKSINLLPKSCNIRLGLKAKYSHV